MIDPKRHWSVLFVLVWCLALSAGMGAGSDAQPQGPTAAQILSKLLPLPDHVPRTIMNPYHAQPAWKLWALDPSPVTIDKPHFKGTFQPPSAGRKYPMFGLKRGSVELILQPLGNSSLSGFWDDCYMSLDFHHTRMGHFKNQFIDGGKMRTARDVQTLLELGVNFTSQSYSDRGRAIVDDVFNNLNTERHFFFANCIRATPSHASYRDVDEDKVTDLYDGLFAHSFHALGQSGSEMHALYKMMVAGACMPRSTKNLLKKHGAYAIALLTIFKAALPYVDAQGRALPFEHELRHRPVYSSHGTPTHPHYCPANAHYHGYDEQRHLRGMMDMARGLESAPPVAVAKLLSFMVKKSGETIAEQARLVKRVKCVSLTNMRFWGEEDETLIVRIDLNKSYDLQNRELHFKCLALYPNQENVSITEETPGIFLIRVKHDPRLPKGRIPVICTAYNGLTVPSNPLFINFYWPNENEADDYFPMKGLSKDAHRKVKSLGLKRLPATVNLRPIVDVGFAGDALRCLPGQNVSVDLSAHDPEGFPVTVVRRAGQIGTIERGRFAASIPATDQDKIYRVHFIFSDGTGGYTGKQIKLIVAKQRDSLPEDWAVTVLGKVQRAVHVSYDGCTFAFGKQPLDRKTSPMQGTFVFQPVPGAADLMCRIPRTNAGTEMALMITNTLDGFSRRCGIGFFQGKISAIMKSREHGRAYQWDAKRTDKREYFRLTLRDALVAAYISTDSKTWEQVIVGRADFFKQCYGGLIYKGDPWDTGVCQWLPSSGSALPILTTGGKRPDKQDRYNGPLEITVTSPDQGTIIRYTLDGSEPTARSQTYRGPIKLTQAGRHEIRVKAFQAGLAQDTTIAAYHLKPVTDKP
jgi:hypothetical protein